MAGKAGIHRKTIKQNVSHKKNTLTAEEKKEVTKEKKRMGRPFGTTRKGRYQLEGGKAFRDDLFHIYEKYGGRKQLLEDVKTDNTLRKDFLKLLFQVYGKELDIESRKKGGGENQKNFIFIMDGLDRKAQDRPPTPEELFLKSMIDPDAADDPPEEDQEPAYNDQPA